MSGCAAPTLNGNTPLHIAAAHGDSVEVSRLLAAGARPDETNAFGKLPEDVTSSADMAILLRAARTSLAHAEHEELMQLRQRTAKAEAKLGLADVLITEQMYRISILVAGMKELRRR